MKRRLVWAGLLLGLLVLAAGGALVGGADRLYGTLTRKERR
jgi:hypothetical protein